MQEKKQKEEEKEGCVELGDDSSAMQMALYSFDEHEIPESMQTPYTGNSGKKTVHFKYAVPVSSIAVQVAFNSRELKGEHLTKETPRSRKYAE